MTGDRAAFDDLAWARERDVRRRVVMFSGGITSWAVARRVAGCHGAEEMTLLIADTHAEDQDLWRFAAHASEGIGVPLTTVEDGRDPWTVFEHEHYLGNSHIAPCSRLLKQVPCREWVEAHTDPADTVLYVGLDWSEPHRFEAVVRQWAPWPVRFPLAGPPYHDKVFFLNQARSLGIEPPRLYGLGFPHNNCGGACVRAGQATWARLLEIFPERYRRNEENEERFRANHGDFSILKDRRGGVTRPLTLRQLRERIEAEQAGRGASPLFEITAAYDADDWGGCGCMADGA